MSKRNFNVYFNLGLLTQVMVRYLTVCDTEAVPNFVVESVLPQQLQEQVKTNALLDISYANNNPLRTVGPVALVVRLGQWAVKLDFICRFLPVPVILGCDYCD